MHEAMPSLVLEKWHNSTDLAVAAELLDGAPLGDGEFDEDAEAAPAGGENTDKLLKLALVNLIQQQQSKVTKKKRIPGLPDGGTESDSGDEGLGRLTGAPGSAAA